MANLLTYRGSGELQYVNEAERDNLAEIVLEQFAASSGPGSISTTNPGAATLIGSFTDTRFQGAVGSTDTTVLSTVYELYQDLTTSFGSISDLPVVWNDISGEVEETADTDLNDIADEILEYMVIQEGPGAIVLDTAPPEDGGLWGSLGTFTDITNEFIDLDVQLWQKESNFLADVVDAPLLRIVESVGETTLQEMSIAQIQQLVAKIRERIVTTGVGQYRLQETAPTPGTWISKGTITDTRPSTSGTLYLGSVPYVDEIPASYSGVGAVTYTGEYVADQYQATYILEIDYVGNYSTPANYVGDYVLTSTYLGEYVGNYLTDVNYEGVVFTPVNYVGDYVRTRTEEINYQRVRTQEIGYTRDRAQEIGYTRTRTQEIGYDTVVGGGPKSPGTPTTYFGTSFFTGTYFGTAFFQGTYFGTSFYTGDYFGTSFYTGEYFGDYVGTVVTPTLYTGTEAYLGDYVGNYTSDATYLGDYLTELLYQGNYILEVSFEGAYEGLSPVTYSSPIAFNVVYQTDYNTEYDSSYTGFTTVNYEGVQEINFDISYAGFLAEYTSEVPEVYIGPGPVNYQSTYTGGTQVDYTGPGETDYVTEYNLVLDYSEDYGAIANYAGTYTSDVEFTQGYVGVENFTESYISESDYEGTYTGIETYVASYQGALTYVSDYQGIESYDVDYIASFGTVYSGDYIGNASTWSLVAATNDGITRNWSAQSGQPNGIYFRDDGLKVYVLDRVSAIYEFDVSTPWDLSTITYTGRRTLTGFSVQMALWFKPDGTKMYVTRFSPSNIYQYTLTTPWDISSAVYDSITVPTVESTPQDLYFRADGLKYWITGNSGPVREFNLTTPWDLSTSTAGSVVAVGGLTVGVFFKTDGTKMFTFLNSGNQMREWDLSTPWDITTLSLIRTFSTGVASNGIFWKSDGSKFYVTSQSPSVTTQFGTTGTITSYSGFTAPSFTAYVGEFASGYDTAYTTSVPVPVDYTNEFQVLIDYDTGYVTDVDYFGNYIIGDYISTYGGFSSSYIGGAPYDFEYVGEVFYVGSFLGTQDFTSNYIAGTEFTSTFSSFTDYATGYTGFVDTTYTGDSVFVIASYDGPFYEGEADSTPYSGFADVNYVASFVSPTPTNYTTTQPQDFLSSYEVDYTADYVATIFAIADYTTLEPITFQESYIADEYFGDYTDEYVADAANYSGFATVTYTETDAYEASYANLTINNDSIEVSTKTLWRRIE